MVPLIGNFLIDINHLDEDHFEDVLELLLGDGVRETVDVGDQGFAGNLLDSGGLDLLVGEDRVHRIEEVSKIFLEEGRLVFADIVNNLQTVLALILVLQDDFESRLEQGETELVVLFELGWLEDSDEVTQAGDRGRFEGEIGALDTLFDDLRDLILVLVEEPRGEHQDVGENSETALLLDL